MAEVAPLLTRQGWELVTPVAASGAATGGAVGGAAGLALAAAGAGILVLAFLMAKRASQRATAPKGKAAPKVAAKNSAGAAGAGSGRVQGLLNRLKPGGRASSGGGGSGSPGGGRSGGGRGRMRLPGMGKRSGTGSTGTGSAGGSKSGTGGPKAGTGRLAGLRGKLPGRKTGTGASNGQRGARGAKSGGSTNRSKGSGPGLMQRARNLGRARKLGAARQLSPGQPGRSRGAGGRPATHKPGSVRRGLGYLATGRKAPTGGGQPKTGPKGGTIGAATGEPRKGRLQKIGQLIPSGKRQRLANRAAAGDTTTGGNTPRAGRRGTSAVARRAIDNATSTPVGKRRRTMGDNTMPLLRRPTINKTGLARTGASQLGSAPASGRTPFAPVIEACGQAAQSYSPENALRAIEWYEGLPQLIEAISSMLGAHARKNQEDFYLYPAAAEIANALATKFLAYQPAVEDARGAFEGAHAEDLAKLRDPKPNQFKWDLTLNRE